MNITETIQAILDKGATQIVIGRVPNDTSQLFVQTDQAMQTGPAGCSLAVRHQRAGASLPELLQQIGRDMDHCGQLKTNIIQVRGNGGRP